MATRNSPQPRPGTPIENRNFLSPVGFKFGLKRSPAVAFFCNEANIPSIDLGIAEQPSYLKNIPVPEQTITPSAYTVNPRITSSLLGLVSPN